MESSPVVVVVVAAAVAAAAAAVAVVVVIVVVVAAAVAAAAAVVAVAVLGVVTWRFTPSRVDTPETSTALRESFSGLLGVVFFDIYFAPERGTGVTVIG